jgi:uncharacterized protein YcaQ
MARKSISLSEARRIAIAAQGFDRARPKTAVNIAHIRRVIRQLGLLQLDFVNVLVPAHYLVIYSRLGAYDRRRFNDLVYRRGDFTEQWAHEASIVPVQLWPLLEHRRNEYRPYPNSPIMKLRGRKKYLAEALELVKGKGTPVTAQDLPPMAGPKRKPGDWHRSVPRWALEYHFGSGELAVADRLPNFQRVYDLPERLIEPQHRLNRHSREESQRELLRLAANACGIGTARDLGDYFRMSPKDVAPRLDELEEEGAIRKVAVAGWTEPAYLAKAARIPRSVSCASLLSPFDPVVWFRPRAQRLFDFHYRIEIYVPANKRKWGYYVLPFLLDERIVARVDLKADRKNKQLLVLACHKEADIDEGRAVLELARELHSLAGWLDLERVKVSRRGAFARQLAIYVKQNPAEQM